VWALVLTKIVQWIFNHFVLRKILKEWQIKINYFNFRKELTIFWKFSIPAIISGSIPGSVSWIATAIVVNQPNGYAEMGIFNAANQWRTYLMFFPIVIGQVTLPILSERFGENDIQGMNKTLKASLFINSLATIPIAVLIAFFSKPIMGLYGNEFSAGWSTLVLVLAFTALISLQVPVGQIIASQGRMWLGLVINLGWALLFFTAFIFLKSQGAFGLALSILISYVIYSFFIFWYSNYILKYEKQYKS
jgi:O-antigen/teichoic acid export membrane protein